MKIFNVVFVAVLTFTNNAPYAQDEVSVKQECINHIRPHVVKLIASMHSSTTKIRREIQTKLKTTNSDANRSVLNSTMGYLDGTVDEGQYSLYGSIDRLCEKVEERQKIVDSIDN